MKIKSIFYTVSYNEKMSKLSQSIYVDIKLTKIGALWYALRAWL